MMKTTIVLLLFGLLTSLNGQAQQKESNDSEKKKATSSKQMNLLDEQVKVLNSVFELGGATENPLGGNTTYLGLLESVEIDPELKKELLEQYKIYDLSLDPKKKDSLKIMVNKMLKEAMAKSQNDLEN